MDGYVTSIGFALWGSASYLKVYDEAVRLANIEIAEIDILVDDWKKGVAAGLLATGHGPLEGRKDVVFQELSAAMLKKAQDLRLAGNAANATIPKFRAVKVDLLAAYCKVLTPAKALAEQMSAVVQFMAPFSQRVTQIGPKLKKVEPKTGAGVQDLIDAVALLKPAIDAYADAALIAAVSAGGDAVALGLKVTAIKAKTAKKCYFGAAQLAADSFKVSDLAKGKTDYEQSIFKVRGEQAKRVGTAFSAVADLEKVAIGATLVRLATAATAWDQAEAHYAAGKYAEAMQIVNAEEANTDAALREMEGYVPDRVKTKLDQLKLDANYALAAPLLEGVPKTMDMLARIAKFGIDFSGELTALHKVCDDAALLLAGLADPAGHAAEAVAGAKEVVNTLKAHDSYAEFFKGALDPIEVKLGQVLTTEVLQQTLTTLKALAAHAPGHTAFERARSSATDSLDSIDRHASKAFVSLQRGQIAEMIRLANESAATHDTAEAIRIAETAVARGHEATNLLRAYEEYLKSLAKFDTFVTGLRDNLAVEHLALLGFLTTARATSQLRVADQQLPAAHTALNKGLDDAVNMDKVIAVLKPAAVASVTKMALESRFRLDLKVMEDADNEINYNQRNVSIRRVYEVMTKVPDKHHRDKNSLRRLEMFPKEVGTSYYSSDRKLIQLKCGRSDDHVAEQISDTTKELTQPIDEDCKPKPGAAKPARFDWTVMHEVGHAIDDSEGEFMLKKHLNQAEFGTWQAHTIAQVVDAVYAVWAYDKDYLYEALCGNQPAPVARPDTFGGDDPAWDKLRTDALAWIALVREDAANWWDGGKCAAAQAKFGKRVYVESYTRTWHSYAFDARKQGITGYQFRSPWEWFSEIYAAYRTGVLKDTHPAIDRGNGWMPTLLN